MSAPLDLRQLTLERPAAPKRLRRPIISRFVVPGAIVLGFLAMIGWAARDQFLPRTSVTVVPVVVSRAEVQQAGAPLFQAAGWVEPRPTAVLVAALADGVVEELLVVEGQSVKAGDAVARLIDADSRLALRQAETELLLRKAESDSAAAEVKATQQRFDNPLHLDAAIAEADSRLASVETELGKLPFLIESAEASLAYAEKNLASKRAAADGIAGRIILQAENEVTIASAQLRELKDRKPKLDREVEFLRKRREALAEQRRLLVDEDQQLTDAKAKLAAAQARTTQAELSLEQVQLQLDRMTVKSPITGRVLALIARPGSRITANANPGEGVPNAVVSLYDPAMLQVRADVRLEDVPLIQPGQPVEIETASSKEVIHGTLLFVTSSANIQKNTLEVKVAIDNPPTTIRPEMLVTATFLAPKLAAVSAKTAKQIERLLVPRSLVNGDGEVRTLWIVDAQNLARVRSVRLGRAGTPTLVEVTEGLLPTDKLIASPREGLSDGARVVISSDDSGLGQPTSVLESDAST